MVVSVAALLVSNPSPAREDVQQAVSGNLCRCGTYPNVISAALAAAAARKGAK
jgi:carbon-monoxide dehydrogenase small subunit/xanthine dehydrogenase YagT iron-sulfur-binding subunit